MSHNTPPSLQLGIELLLQSNEQEAQMAWLDALSSLGEVEASEFFLELAESLVTEGNKQKNLGNWSLAWLLYRYACENSPSLENWLQALQASLQARVKSSESDLETDWEALGQCLEMLTAQKFMIAPELIPLLFTSLEILRSQSQSLENLDVDTYYYLGLLYRREHKIYEAIAAYQEAVNLAPERLEIYESLIESLIILANSGLQIHSDWRNVTEIYLQVCHELNALNASDPQLIQNAISKSIPQCHWSAASLRVKSYLMSGMYDQALTYFLELEAQIYANPDCLSAEDWRSLYLNLLFLVPFLRDDPVLNGQLFEFIGDRSRQSWLQDIFNDHPQFQFTPKILTNSPSVSGSTPKRSLRIGIMSGLLRRHSVSWCAKDWLFELAKIAPDTRFYLTAQFPADDITQQFEQLGDRLYKMQSTSEERQIAEITQRIINDDLDVLIDLDAMMNSLHAPIMAAKPAKHCISWAGFASPYLTQNNYFLGDRHLLPPEVEPHFVERLLRMPDSYVAMQELASVPIDRQAVRQSLGIVPEQLVYLTISAGHKFNPATASAIAQILQRVPNSVLLHKGKGELEVIKGIYEQACDRYHVDCGRIKFLPPRTKTEEEHRSTYQLADILLDSYPYNSCTHSLEAFWQGLPVVTIVGAQMFSRFGYSFFPTLGIQEGIAWNWEEYVQWGERLGKDRDLRESLSIALYQAKQPETLSPLWNPAKFAQDLYDLLLRL